MKLNLRERVAWIVEHWRLYRSDVPLLLALVVVNAAVLVVYPFFIKLIIEGMETSATPAYFARWTSILLGLGAVHFVIYLSMQLMRTRLNTSFEYGVRLRGFENITRMGPSFFGRLRTGDLVTRLMDDVSDKLSWYMCSGIFRVIEASILIVFCVAMMLLISPRLTLYAAGPLPVLILIFFMCADQLHRRYEVVQQSISRLNEVLETCFSGMRIVKAFTAEPMQRAIVGEAIEQNREAEVRAVRWQTVLDTLWGNIWQLGIIGVLLVGGGMAMRGEVSLGDLVAFDTYVLMLVWPMFDIGQFLVRGKLSAVSIDRLVELEDAAPDVDDPSLIGAVARRPGEAAPADHEYDRQAAQAVDVQFREVTFAYGEATRNALEKVSFRAQSGRLTALVGETGAGKSTAMALVARLFDPASGEIVVGTQEMKQWNLITLRQKTGYVPQEAMLLSGSVLENIRFGRQWITDDDVEMAIEISQLRGDLSVWHDGLQTVVGSRGVRLSGGQKQRVALARALTGRPSILLLDDCTASLDAATEDAVWQRLFTEIPGCTTLLVTHRPGTLARADQIVVLDEGRVCESGTFAELNLHDTLFHQLYVQWQLRERIEK